VKKYNSCFLSHLFSTTSKALLEWTFTTKLRTPFEARSSKPKVCISMKTVEIALAVLEKGSRTQMFSRQGIARVSRRICQVACRQVGGGGLYFFDGQQEDLKR